jgi:hypothetical protein
MVGSDRKRKLRNTLLAALVGIAALSLSGCVTLAQEPWGTRLTFSRHTTDELILAWAGPACDQDLNGNGVSGGPQDRAYCAFYLIRGICNGTNDAALKLYCYEGTERGRNQQGYWLWSDLDEAAQNLARIPGCLTFDHLSPVGDTYPNGVGDAWGYVEARNIYCPKN